MKIILHSKIYNNAKILAALRRKFDCIECSLEKIYFECNDNPYDENNEDIMASSTLKTPEQRDKFDEIFFFLNKKFSAPILKWIKLLEWEKLSKNWHGKIKYKNTEIRLTQGAYINNSENFYQAQAKSKNGNKYMVFWKITRDDPKNCEDESEMFDWDKYTVEKQGKIKEKMKERYNKRANLFLKFLLSDLLCHHKIILTNLEKKHENL